MAKVSGYEFVGKPERGLFQQQVQGLQVGLQALFQRGVLPEFALAYLDQADTVAEEFADLAGGVDSPLYGMFDMSSKLSEHDQLEQWFTRQPVNPYEYSLKWDGEWQVTFETFRDMGAAYAVGLLMIYLLVVAQFHSYKVPLVIMAPIPLTQSI